MMYITCDKVLFTWHIGESVPIVAAETAQLVSVQADGHELELLKNRFENLPHPTSWPKFVRWYGDDARFILGNLDLYPE